MATYPDDATISQESFSVASSKTFSSTGATTVFALDSAATFVGEIIAIADGVTQPTDSYTLATSGEAITFLAAPSASNLTLKVVNVPDRFKVNRTVDTASVVNYSNTSSVTVNSNAFLKSLNLFFKGFEGGPPFVPQAKNIKS